MSRPTSIRRAIVALAALASTTAVGALTALPASAHVNATGTTAAGGATTVSFTFTHGCGESPTTSLRVQLPAGTTAVTAENPAGFTSAVTDTEIAWTGGSVPSGQRGTFTATMRLPGQAGDTVYLPAIQECPAGEEAWLERTPDAEAEHAAPRVVLTSGSEPTTTEAADHDHDADATTTTASTTTSATPTTTAGVTTTAAPAPTTSTTSAPATAPASSSSNAGLIIGAIVLALLVAGGIVAALRRRTPTP